MRHLFAVLLILSVLAPATADPIENADTTTGIAVGGNHGLVFATGGIGQDQQAAMEKISPDCNLRLTFSQEKSGDFLADVTVKIQNGAGEDVFDVGHAGPLFYTKLPPGKYVITAEWRGKQQKKEVTIAKVGAESLYLYWAD